MLAWPQTMFIPAARLATPVLWPPVVKGSRAPEPGACPAAPHCHNASSNIVFGTLAFSSGERLRCHNVARDGAEYAASAGPTRGAAATT